MSFEDLIYACRKLTALHDAYDELWSMRIHAFDKNITYFIKRVKELCEEELEEELKE